jgi:lysophospholipase L1-like esterase
MTRARFLMAMLMSCVALRGALFAADNDPARWEDDIRAFEAEDREHPPAPGGVLFVGSSSIRLWKLEESFPDLKPLNRGFGGSEIADSLHFADRIILPYRPRAIVFYAGDNDTANGKSAAQVREDFGKLYEKIHAALPETKVLFLAIKPSRARWELIETQREANRLIAEFAEEQEQLEFVDVATPLLGEDGLPREALFEKDRLHLNAAGYEVWNGVLAPLLAE